MKNSEKWDGDPFSGPFCQRVLSEVHADTVFVQKSMLTGCSFRGPCWQGVLSEVHSFSVSCHRSMLSGCCFTGPCCQGVVSQVHAVRVFGQRSMLSGCSVRGPSRQCHFRECHSGDVCWLSFWRCLLVICFFVLLSDWSFCDGALSQRVSLECKR